ncbi:transposase [Streptomyces atratus]|uniref:transposase n=1 Tax=Streptomyces atratus TaxID=1893 RepID=UPI00338EA948
MRELAPAVLEVPGCGVIDAAAIVDETAGTARSKSKEAFAHFNGTAPIPSGPPTRSGFGSTAAETGRS